MLKKEMTVMTSKGKKKISKYPALPENKDKSLLMRFSDLP